MKKNIFYSVFTIFIYCNLFSQSNLFASSIGSIKAKEYNYIATGYLLSRFKEKGIEIFKTNFLLSRGTIFLLPELGFKNITKKKANEMMVSFLANHGYDVAMYKYNKNKYNASGLSILENALNAYRFLKTKRIGAKRLHIMGISSGGFIAAQIVQKLSQNEQPEKLILISPSNLDETIPGTVFPLVMPPISPASRLLATFSKNDNKSWIKSCEEYTKTWTGYDGDATFKLLDDSLFLADKNRHPFNNNQLLELIKFFLDSKPEPKINSSNPAAIPVEGRLVKRHLEKLELVSNRKFDLILIGNSITNNFEKPQYQAVWNRYFGSRNALNLGFSGYRTENILWNLEHGELDGQSPKVVILHIGTNNIDEKNYPTRHTAGQLAGGIEAIVSIIRQKLPHTKIILMRCFPGCYGGPNPTSHRFILERASDIVSKMADGKYIFICDVNHVFLNKDGTINYDMMGDWLHPTPLGASAWLETMEPLLAKLFGDNIHTFN